MKFIYFIFTLFSFIQYNECHIEWFTQGIPNFINETLSQIKKHIHKDSSGDAEYDIFLDYVNSQPSINYETSGEDPTINMTTPQLIAFNGYICESHTIVTEDGYILTVHRIPHAKEKRNIVNSRNTVLLHHGLLGSSADWVISGPGKGLAYILADAGHDVWMANARGNIYSRSHISLSKNKSAFWNFTFDEISYYDLPAVIDYINYKKGLNSKLSYIGHSMGTTVLFALLSTKSHYNNVLAAGFGLAPVASMTEIKSPMRLIAKYSDKTEFLQKLFGNEFAPKGVVLDWLSYDVCADCNNVFCEHSIFMMCGPSTKELNVTLLPKIIAYTPAGTSSKTIIHYAQEIKNEGRFQKFDYGIEGNIRAYGTFGPPEYNLTKITLPIALFSTKNDWLAGEGDVSILNLNISDLIEHYVVPKHDFNHLDFLWARNAPTIVYDKLLQLLKMVDDQLSFTPR